MINDCCPRGSSAKPRTFGIKNTDSGVPLDALTPGMRYVVVRDKTVSRFDWFGADAMRVYMAFARCLLNFFTQLTFLCILIHRRYHICICGSVVVNIMYSFHGNSFPNLH